MVQYSLLSLTVEQLFKFLLWNDFVEVLLFRLVEVRRVWSDSLLNWIEALFSPKSGRLLALLHFFIQIFPVVFNPWINLVQKFEIMSVKIDVLHFGQKLAFKCQENLIFLQDFIFVAIPDKHSLILIERL